MTPQQFDLARRLAWLPGRYGDAIAALRNVYLAVCEDNRLLGLEIERLFTALSLYRMAKDKLQWVEAERDALKGRVADLDKIINPDNGRTLTCNICGETALQVCTHICDARETLEARIAALESAPIHPAVVAVVEAAKARVAAYHCTPDKLMAEGKKLYDAVAALPSPLPSVVTCGECERGNTISDGIVYCESLGINRDSGGFCHLGKRGGVVSEHEVGDYSGMSTWEALMCLSAAPSGGRRWSPNEHSQTNSNYGALLAALLVPSSGCSIPIERTPEPSKELTCDRCRKVLLG